ncbi:hypothetical protein ESOG_04742 [Escherichia coli E101]|nr:hypothetical protein ESOG_04742 [Escherichia coli E101]
MVYRLAYMKKSGNRLSLCPDFVIHYNTQSLALKHTYEVYFGYDRTLRKYSRFRQKLPVKTDFRKNSARRRPVTGRSPRTGEEAQYICSYSEQVRPEAFIIGSVFNRKRQYEEDLLNDENLQECQAVPVAITETHDPIKPVIKSFLAQQV